MSLNAILFDLDGTLLPMDQEQFIQAYFTEISSYMKQYGYEEKKLIKAIWAGTSAMVKNNGTMSNMDAFWGVFREIYGDKMINDVPRFDEFYKTEFDKVSRICHPTFQAAELVKRLKSEGYRVILATSPIFPRIATECRIRWAGLDASDFEYVTTYENSHFCKPSPLYYDEIAKKCSLDAAECLMVGNDVDDDMTASLANMHVFLLTDCLINKNKTDIDRYPNGSFAELVAFIDSLK